MTPAPSRPIAVGKRGAKPLRTFQPRLQKPLGAHCDTCPLAGPGQGYVPAGGPQTAPLVFLGENPWYDEVALGEPLVGASGAMLTRVLRLLGKQREDYRLDNLIRCAVPGGEIHKWPHAMDQCQYHQATLAERPRVIVTLGSTPLQRLLQLAGTRHEGVEQFHGTVHRWGDHWVVPTYHPAHLVRGATNLIGVMAFDLTRAHEVADHGWAPDPAVVVVDPPLEWFRAWAALYIDAVRTHGPWAIPLAVDIETPEKQANEGALIGTGADASYQILRVNLSMNPDEGITVPFEYGYLEVLHEIFAAGGVQYYWYKGYDYPRLAAAGLPMRADRAWDAMWMWKVLQSDLPASLGFVAPFYSRYGAWKHLADRDPGRYAAIDAFQTRRVGDGMAADLHQSGRWDVFQRHFHDFHRIVLQPATDVGLPIHRARLLAFKDKLDAEATRLLGVMQACVPIDQRVLTPKQGLTKPPKPGVVHTKARTTTAAGAPKKDAPDPIKVGIYAQATVVEKLVIAEVLQCTVCQQLQVTATHNCQGKAGRPPLTKVTASVTRWFWQEPFNPDSPPQIMAYVKAQGHQPGTSKTTGNDSVDRETLSRLVRETGDPLYEHLLAFRAVQKVRGTYVEGTLRRLDTDDRVHPETTFKPSTHRTSQVNPNLQNVVADKGGKESLAAGFRKVVVARGQWVEEGSEYADA